MRTFIAIAVTAATLLAIAGEAQARPHKVCSVHHHHRHCHWVR